MTRLEAACEGVVEHVHACAMVARDVPEFLQLCRERFERFAASQQGQDVDAPGPHPDEGKPGGPPAGPVRGSGESVAGVPLDAEGKPPVIHGGEPVTPASGDPFSRPPAPACPACGKPLTEHEGWGDLKLGAVLMCPAPDRNLDPDTREET